MIKKILITFLILAILGGIAFLYFLSLFAKGFTGTDKERTYRTPIICIEHNIKTEILKESVSDFKLQFPEHIVPDSIKRDCSYQQFSYHDHLQLDEFYFTEKPYEIYLVQWTGPGCINVRFAYNPFTDKTSNTFHKNQNDSIVRQELNRIKKRFEGEIITKMESMLINKNLGNN